LIGRFAGSLGSRFHRATAPAAPAIAGPHILHEWHSTKYQRSSTTEYRETFQERPGDSHPHDGHGSIF
jgi:hypothetical protein